MSDKERRFVILDRDGTLIRERNYLSDPDQVELIERLLDRDRQARERGLFT